MRNIAAKLLLTGVIAASATSINAQVLNLSIKVTTGNVVKIIGTASAPGFTNGAATSWGAMNITLRIPKSETTPAPTPANTGTAATNITAVSSAFTGAMPRNAFTGTATLSAFDLAQFGLPDDGNWYFQISESAIGGNQPINAGEDVVVYEYKVPDGWVCNSCMEIVTTQIAGLPISTLPFIDNAGTGGNVISVQQSITPLPVTLLDFTAAQTTDGRVQLNWQTAQEQGADYFEAERSTNGKSFGKIIAHMKAAGSSTGALNYQSYDVSPLAGMNYYRLKMVNTNGKYTYSQIRKVTFGDAMAGVIVYPTDNTDGIIKIILPEGCEHASVSLIDAVGRQLPVSISGSALKKVIELSGISAGNYLVAIDNNGLRKTVKVSYHP